MKVYVVYHADIEDDRYVRYVTLDRDLAEKLAPTRETNYVEDHPRDHSEYCCGVDEYDLTESWPELWQGPEKPWGLAGPRLIPDPLVEAMGQMLERSVALRSSPFAWQTRLED